jgi:hypothetical protein
MTAPITIITRSGEEISLSAWQKAYGLEVGSAQIGKYFSATESRFAGDIQTFGKLVVNELLMIVMDEFRRRRGFAVNINSFNRTEAYQKQLTGEGYRTATVSPHVALMAADIDTATADQTRSEAALLQQISLELGIRIRVGYADYLKAGQTFIHVDVCPEYFGTGKPFHHHQHPKAWEQVLTW